MYIMYCCIINKGSLLCDTVKSAQGLHPSLLFFHCLEYHLLTDPFSDPAHAVCHSAHSAGEISEVFFTLSLEVAWANQTQASVPPLTPALVVCNIVLSLLFNCQVHS